MSEDQDSAIGRGRMSMSKRIELLEHDREQQSRIITELVATLGKGFSDAQLAQIRAAMREELADSGLRIEGAEHQDEAREDFRFLRRARKSFDSASTQIGRSLLLGVIGVVAVILSMGFWQWISTGGK